MRTKMLNIKMLRTATREIVLFQGQYFCETAAAYEIWQEQLLLRIARIPKKQVLWIFEK